LNHDERPWCKGKCLHQGRSVYAGGFYAYEIQKVFLRFCAFSWEKIVSLIALVPLRGDALKCSENEKKPEKSQVLVFIHIKT
jgi:hypothetical protein